MATKAEPSASAGVNSANGQANHDDQRTDDGRLINPKLGTLSGEGAQQERTQVQPHPDRTQEKVWTQLPSQTQQGAQGPTYYDRPVIKEPIWIWTVPLYFFVGGAAGAAAVLGEVARLLGKGQLPGLVTRCRWIAASGADLGAVLLIADLGRPSRFLNMLRVFRPTSPMSVGSWILVAFGGLTTLAAFLNGRRGPLKWISDSAAAVSSPFGIGLAGYTGVLLGNSVVPLWLATRRSLPLLFMSSGVASAAALLELTGLNTKERRVVQRFGLVGRTAELLAAHWLEQEANQVAQVAKPLHEGASGDLWKASKVAGIVGLLLALLPGNGWPKRLAAASCTIAASLLLRYGMMLAGKVSARDPHATFQQQRAQKL